jgi:hypothetical protein
MQPGSFFTEMPRFRNPEEEVDYLREYITKREEELKKMGHIDQMINKAALDVIEAYKSVPVEKVVHNSHVIDKKTHKKILSALQIEPHNTVLEELLGLMITKGVRNSLAVVEVMNNPYIYADFHYFLIQYLKNGQVKITEKI